MRQRVAHLLRRIADRVMRSRNMVALQEFLGKAFARFKLRGRFRWAEGAPASSREFVHYAEHERQFRPDDGKVGLNLIRERDHGIEALYVNRDAFRVVRNAAIPRRAVDFRDSRRLPQLPYQGVLASATADDEDLHGSRHSRVGAREDDVKRENPLQRSEVRLQR